MKLLGLLSVFTAFAGMSLTIVERSRREMNMTEGLCVGVKLMRSEMAASLRPMRDLLCLAAESAAGEASAFFTDLSKRFDDLTCRQFSELWIEECRNDRSLPDEFRRELETLGCSLGRFALPDQLAACDRFLAYAEEWLKINRAKYYEKRRLTLCLGATAGIFVGLLIG